MNRSHCTNLVHIEEALCHQENREHDSLVTTRVMQTQAKWPTEIAVCGDICHCQVFPNLYSKQPDISKLANTK
jgi:ferritin-like protein